MNLFFKAATLLAFSLPVLSGCGRTSGGDAREYGSTPQFLRLETSGGLVSAISVSPFDGSSDTLSIDFPVKRLVVMSTSHIGFLDALGCDSLVVGVSGLDYVCDSSVASRPDVADVGYEASPDYEKIVSLHPDLVLSYSLSGGKSKFVRTLESLGLRVFLLNEHLEGDPLAKAAYVRFFGAIAGRMEAADSVLLAVSGNYERLRASASCASPKKVLMNIPYNDQWFIPGGESYMTRLVEDAGGTVLGTVAGRTESSVISVEKAYSLAGEADLWLNVGWCSTMSQLEAENPLFGDFVSEIGKNASRHGLAGAPFVWNCNKRLNAGGGNDFWESGAVRPDLILEDLAAVFSGRAGEETYYYKPLR